MKKRSISFVISKDEETMLEKVIIFEPFLQDNLNNKKKTGKNVTISFDAYDLFDAISALKFEKNNIKSHREKAKLDIFINKLISYLNLTHQSEDKLGI